MGQEPPRYFSVKDFEKFQHYKHRNPPWIKLYREVITDYDLRKCPPCTRLAYIGCLVLASETLNRVALDYPYLSQRLGFQVKESTLTPLFHSGHLLALGASNMLAGTASTSRVEESRDRVEYIPPPPSEGSPPPLGVVLAPWEAFCVTESLKAWAHQHNLPDPEGFVEEFRDHYRVTGGKLSSGRTVRDWPAAFRTWMRNVPRFRKKKGGLDL